MEVHIDLTKKGLTLNGVFMEHISEEKFAEVLGEPRKNLFQGKHKGKAFSRNVWIWDNFGFLINIPTENDRHHSIEFEVIEDLEFQKSVKYNFFDVNPTGLFTSKFTIEGKPILEAFTEKQRKEAYIWLEKKVGNWKMSFDISDEVQAKIEALLYEEKEAGKVADLLRNSSPIFKSFWIAYEPPKVSLGKWKLPKATATDLTFKNLNFKLAIVQELMYVQEVLTPKFDVFDFCEDYAKREIDPNDYSFEMIPEVKKWFKDLPIPASLAEKVTELYFDGGNDIYGQLIPYWDGEDDIYDIKAITEEELAQFPNLKKIDGMAILISAKMQKFLKEKGIEIVG